MTGEDFLKLSKESKQDFVFSTLTKKKDSPDGKVYFIEKTACCRAYVEWGWGQAPKVCPHCGNIHWQKPALEFFLFSEQDKFVKEYPDLTRLGSKMFPLILDYAKNLIQSLIKGNTLLNSDDLDEKANDAATSLIEVILKDPNHCMRYSFGEYLKRLCKSVTFGPKDHEQTLSLNSILGDGEKEFGDTIIIKGHTGAVDMASSNDSISEEVRMNNCLEEFEFQNDLDLPTILIDIVQKSSNAIWENTRDQKNSVLFILGLILKFKGTNDKLLSEFFSLTGIQTKKFVDRGELLLYEYLKSVVS